MEVVRTAFDVLQPHQLINTTMRKPKTGNMGGHFNSTHARSMKQTILQRQYNETPGDSFLHCALISILLLSDYRPVQFRCFRGEYQKEGAGAIEGARLSQIGRLRGRGQLISIHLISK